MRNTTICLLLKDGSVLLAMKKRGYGVGKWNGVGGKAADGESIEETTIRETEEEIGVTPTRLTKVATINFLFPPDQQSDHQCFVFTCDQWKGTPSESEEMRPVWFPLDKIPYKDMWESDRLWLPKILNGQKMTVTVRSDANDKMVGYEELPNRV
ncbi:MAG TPA: 8-oxo-dGTP diphosphatase [Candidatus Saccharimonadales bacterium]|nr:8-oxo-dGTP diphosphatase [Candidatus Saccharimonadales bacterium]